MAQDRDIDPARLDAALSSRIGSGSGATIFGEMTAADARVRGEGLSEVGSWGPLQRVAKVAMAWKMLAAQMDRDGVDIVKELEPADVLEYAERLWIVPPEEGMIEGIRG